MTQPACGTAEGLYNCFQGLGCDGTNLNLGKKNSTFKEESSMGDMFLVPFLSVRTFK